VLSTSSYKFLFLFLCGGCSLTATTAPSLTPTRPEWFPYKIPLTSGSHHHQKFFFKRRGKITPSGRRSHISGSSYANIASNTSLFFRFGEGRPLHNARSLFSRSGGRRSLHTAQSLTFHNPLNIPVALFMNSSDVLSILTCSCRVWALTSDFAFWALPAFHPGHPSVRGQRVICLPAAANSFRGPQFPWLRNVLKTFPLRSATAARRVTFLQAAANFLPDPQSPWVSSFGSPRRPAVNFGSCTSSSLFPKISQRPLP
jgi:hypothetical protein